MSPFKLPPEIDGGHLTIDGKVFPPEHFSWKPIEATRLRDGKQEVLTSKGEGECAGRPVQILVGYEGDDRLPFADVTVWAPIDRNASCSFNFAEVL